MKLLTECWPSALAAAGVPPRRHIEFLEALGRNVEMEDETAEVLFVNNDPSVQFSLRPTKRGFAVSP